MSDKPKMKIEFAPGVLEELEGSMPPDELQAMMDEIKAKIEDGSLFTESTLVDMDALAEEDPALYEMLQQSLEESDTPVEPKKLH